MCITVSASEMSDTKILSIPVGNGNHFIAYSNSIVNKTNEPNGMILPVPGVTKQEWFYDTTEYTGFLDEIIDNARLQQDYLGKKSRGLKLGSFSLGMYKVFITSSVNELIDVILSLDTNEKPTVNPKLYDFFEENYPDCSFVLCLFGKDEIISSQPIAFEYTPNDPDLLYFPTMDSHTGDVPNLNEQVVIDHIFIYEHTGPQPLFIIKNSTKLETNVPEFLKDRKYRFYRTGVDDEINGDTFFNVSNILETSFVASPNFYRGTIANKVNLN